MLKPRFSVLTSVRQFWPGASQPVRWAATRSTTRRPQDTNQSDASPPGGGAKSVPLDGLLDGNKPSTTTGAGSFAMPHVAEKMQEAKEVTEKIHQITDHLPPVLLFDGLPGKETGARPSSKRASNSSGKAAASTRRSAKAAAASNAAASNAAEAKEAAIVPDESESGAAAKSASGADQLVDDSVWNADQAFEHAPSSVHRDDACPARTPNEAQDASSDNNKTTRASAASGGKQSSDKQSSDKRSSDKGRLKDRDETTRTYELPAEKGKG